MNYYIKVEKTDKHRYHRNYEVSLANVVNGILQGEIKTYVFTVDGNKNVELNSITNYGKNINITADTKVTIDKLVLLSVLATHNKLQLNTDNIKEVLDRFKITDIDITNVGITSECYYNFTVNDEEKPASVVKEFDLYSLLNFTNIKTILDRPVSKYRDSFTILGTIIDTALESIKNKEDKLTYEVAVNDAYDGAVNEVFEIFGDKNINVYTLVESFVDIFLAPKETSEDNTVDNNVLHNVFKTELSNLSVSVNKNTLIVGGNNGTRVSDPTTDVLRTMFDATNNPIHKALLLGITIASNRDNAIDTNILRAIAFMHNI